MTVDLHEFIAYTIAIATCGAFIGYGIRQIIAVLDSTEGSTDTE